MTTWDIRATIDSALALEDETGQLREQVGQRLAELEVNLLLPETDPVSALMTFITGYIESVPASLRLVAAVSQKFGFYGYVAPFLYLAEDYFLRPPEAIPDKQGLLGLLDEAFLAHRLLEEVNDHHVRLLQQPLLPIDMTEANIIVHHLIGDDLASKLEALVQFAASQLLARKASWAHVRSLPVSGKPPPDLIPQAQRIWEPQAVRLRLKQPQDTSE